jgi:phospholipid transport system substrate-binding protein
MMKLCFIRLCAVIGLFVFGSMTLASTNPAPDVLVKNTTEEVLAIVRRDKGIQADNTKRIYELVDTKVLPHFDFERMTQLAVGKYWNKATPAQKQHLVRDFRTLLVRTYASSLRDFGESHVKIKPLNLQPGDNEVTVRTEVQQPGAQPVSIDYRMERTAGGWKAYDITVDGVSLVTNYRSSFANQIRAKGIDGLIEALVAKNTSAAGNP